MNENEAYAMFQNFKKGQDGAKTIISMATDYLLGKIGTKLFADNLIRFANFFKEHAERENSELYL